MEKKLKILHLEDLQSDAELIGIVLKKAHFSFETLLVDTRDQFTKALWEFIPDVILCDHSLPSFNSHEALAVYHESGIKIPFILITANMSEEFAVDIIKRGADDYILKDRLIRLPMAIRNSLEKFRLERERQIYLDKLIKNEKRYRALVENGGEAIVILNPERRLTYVSPSIHRVLGYSEAEAMELDLYKLIHPDDRTAVLEKVAESLSKSGVPLEGLVSRIKHKDGTWRSLESTITNLLDDPAINGIVNNFRDITERKNAEQQLNDSEIFNKGILSSLSSHIAVININGTIIAVNKAWDDFAKECGATSLENTSTGSNYFDVCKKSIVAGDVIADQVLKGMQSIFNKEKTVFSIEYPCHSPNKQRYFMLRAMNFGNDWSKIVITHQDITEKVLANQELRMNEQKYRLLASQLEIKNKDLRQFAYIVSHNLRAPIAKIQGLIFLINNDKDSQEMLPKMLGILSREADQLDTVVKDMNGILSVQDTGSKKKEYVLFDKKLELIKQVLENQVDESKAVIYADFQQAPGLLTVKSYLYSILYNLISNALKYHSEERPLRIDVKTSCTNDLLCLSVKDNGRGIDLQKNGDKIFGLYKRFHGNQIEGTGIGLNLVKAQVESLGGTVEVISVENTGTEFLVYIPINNNHEHN